MSNTKHQKGVSLLFTVLIMSVILSVSLGISGILIQQIRTVEDVGHSVVSFYAADSGVEWRLYDLYKILEGSHQPQHEETLNVIDDSANYTVTADCSPDSTNCYEGLVVDADCDAVNYCLKSIGRFKETKRAIQIKY